MDWNPIITTIIQAAVPVLMSATVYLVVQVARHYGAKISAENEAQINRVLFGAIQFAEEQAAVAKKAGTPMGAEQKLLVASKFAAAQLGDVNPEQFRDSIKAMLPISGAGATKSPQGPAVS